MASHFVLLLFDAFRSRGLLAGRPVAWLYL
jgi:hypothetical protein